MPRHYVEIKSYVVSFARSVPGQPIEASRPWTRQLKLKVRSGSRGLPLNSVEIEFFDPRDRAYLLTVGERNGVSMELPLDDHDFADLYKILQTEKPLVLVWDERVNSPQQSAVLNWRITTSLDEPLGEGQADRN